MMKKFGILVAVLMLVASVSFACSPGKPCSMIKKMAGEWRGKMRTNNPDVADNVKKIVLQINQDWTVTGTFGELKLVNGQISRLKDRSRGTFQEEFIINAELVGNIIAGDEGKHAAVIALSLKDKRIEGTVYSKALKLGATQVLDAQWRLMDMNKLTMP